MTLQAKHILCDDENIAPSEVTDNIGDERGDALRGIPKLRCLDIP